MNQQRLEEMKRVLTIKYRSARLNLILAVALTLVNIIMIFAGSHTYLAFSLAIPMYLVTEGAGMCGFLPEEYYDPDFIYILKEPYVFVILCIVAVAILGACVALWWFSKNNVLFLKISLGVIAVDTVAMFGIFGITSSIIIDVIFHAWLIYYVVSGINADKKLKDIEKTAANQPSQKEDYYSDDFDYSDEDEDSENYEEGDEDESKSNGEE